MIEYWALCCIWISLCIMMGPLMRIANALERLAKLHGEISYDLNRNIKRG